jgi:serine protease Do
MGLRRIIAIGMLGLALLLSFAAFYSRESRITNLATAAAAPEAPASIPAGEPAARAAAQVSPSVVQIDVSFVRQTTFGLQEQQGIGSGVIYTKDGYIITNNHVVEGAREVQVKFADGTTEKGTVVGTDSTTDLAVVKVDRSGLPAAKFGDSGKLVPGQMALSIGSPSGFQSTVSEGVVSGLGREIPPEYTGGRQESSFVDLIQTDAAISPGDSGGALADRAGEVIGINVAYLPPAQTGAVDIGFAIPSDTAASVADQIIESGRATHPYLGLSLASLTPEVARQFHMDVQSGALVTGVDPAGPAANAGVEEGSVITALGGTGITGAADLVAALRDHRPGETVRVTVSSSDGEQQLEVKLGERDTSGAR